MCINRIIFSRTCVKRLTLGSFFLLSFPFHLVKPPRKLVKPDACLDVTYRADCCPPGRPDRTKLIGKVIPGSDFALYTGGMTDETLNVQVPEGFLKFIDKIMTVGGARSNFDRKYGTSKRLKTQVGLAELKETADDRTNIGGIIIGRPIIGR